MIEFFRTFSQSWVARGFFLILALVFLVMWGGGDWSRQLLSHQQSVASVGKETISAWDFFKELGRTLQQLQLSTGQAIDEQRAKELGVYEMVRDKLIEQKLIALETKRLGIYISDEEIKALIKKDKLFQDDKGVFQKARFDAIMKNVGYEEAAYVNALRQDLLRDRLAKALSYATKMPLAISLPLYSWQKEKRTIQAVILSTDTVTVDKRATDADLKKFYEDQKAELKAPEYRDISLLVVNQKKLMDALSIPKSDLEAAYRHRDEEFRGKTFAQAKAQVETDLKRQRTLEAFEKLINQVDDLIGQGKNLEEIAKELSLEIKVYKRITQQGQGDPFRGPTPLQADATDLKAIQEAFTLELEGHSAPLETAQGHYRIARVDAIHPSQTRTFDEVKRKLNDFWVMSKKLEALKAQADTVAHEINNGSPMAVIAGKYKLKVINAKVTRSGPSAPSVLSLSAPLMERIYSSAINEALSVPYHLNDQRGEYIVVQVTAKETPSFQENLDNLEEFKKTLATMVVNDMLTVYVHSLRKRFPVDINQSFFAKAVKQQ